MVLYLSTFTCTVSDQSVIQHTELDILLMKYLVIVLLLLISIVLIIALLWCYICPHSHVMLAVSGQSVIQHTELDIVLMKYLAIVELLLIIVLFFALFIQEALSNISGGMLFQRRGDEMFLSVPGMRDDIHIHHVTLPIRLSIHTADWLLSAVCYLP